MENCQNCLKLEKKISLFEEKITKFKEGEKKFLEDKIEHENLQEKFNEQKNNIRNQKLENIFLNDFNGKKSYFNDFKKLTELDHDIILKGAGENYKNNFKSKYSIFFNEKNNRNQSVMSVGANSTGKINSQPTISIDHSQKNSNDEYII